MPTLINLPKDTLSVSQLNLYQNCGELYYRRYVDKQKAFNLTKIDGLLLGSAFHKFIEEFYKSTPVENSDKYFFDELFSNISHNKLEIIDKDAKEFAVAKFVDMRISEEKDYHNLIDDLEKVFTLDNYQTILTGYIETLKTGDKERPSLYKIFQNLVSYFLDNYSEILQGIELSTSEEDFNFTFERYGKEFNITSRMDFTGINKDGVPVVIDWKTTKRSWNEADVMKKQDIVYSYLYWKRKGVIPLFRYVVFVYSDKTGEIKHQIFDIQYTEKQLMEVEKMIHSIARGVNEKVFIKNESSFLCSSDYCEYYKDCQGYKDGVEVKAVI